MLKSKLAALFQIRPEETRMVVLTAVLFLLIQAGQGFGDTAAFGLFVSKNVDRLPYMYAPLGLIVFVISLAYTASLGRFQNAKVVLWFLAGFMLLLVAEWLLIAQFNVDITQTFWLTVNGMGVVLGTLVWNVAGEVCDARQAKRLFPLFTSVGILGTILGNALAGVVKPIGDAYMILFYAGVLGVSFYFLRTITRDYFTPEAPAPVTLNLVTDLRSGFDYVRGSGLFRLLAFSAVLYSILFFAVDFPFSQFVKQHYSDDVALTRFKGGFSSVVMLVTFLVSLVIANRIYARIGIINSIMLLPITYILGFAAFYTFNEFNTAVAFRFIQQIVLAGVMSTAWSALFNVVPIDRRGQVLAFMNGVPSQIGVILSGLLLVVGSQVLEPKQILLMGALVAVICFYVTWRMRDAYGAALVSALQAGRVDVFNRDDEAFSGYADNPEALQIALRSLGDARPGMRRMAAEMLAKMENPAAVPGLVDRLHDDDAGVRVAVTRALSDLDARTALGPITLGLDDPADSVREETLAALTKLEAASSPELIRTLNRLLADSNVRVGTRAASLLLVLGEGRDAQEFLQRLSGNSEPETHRALVFSAYQVVASRAPGIVPMEAVHAALHDPGPVVRRQALLTAALLKGEALIEAMGALLSDPDTGVRHTASAALRQAWPESRSVVLRLLNDSDGRTVSAALDAIPAGGEDVLDVMRAYIQREVGGIRYWRTVLESLPEQGRMTRLLRHTIHYRITLIEERLVQAVGVFGNPRAMELVRKGVSAGTPAARAAALEALETLGDKRITTEVLPILDRGGMFEDVASVRLTHNDLVEFLIRHEDRWFRALGAFLVIEWDLREYVIEVRKLSVAEDEDLLVRDTAKHALSYLGGAVRMKTLKTLSTLDRVLLLREVPMFSGLSPEDLERIAEIAEEQLFMDKALLCREGEPGNTLFIIASGTVDVLKRNGNTDQLLASRSTGEFVGEMAILESAPRSASLQARGGVRALVIDGNAFSSILLDRPQVAVAVLRNMSARIRELNVKVGVG